MLAHISLALVCVFMGKYIPGLVNKSSKRESFSYIYSCFLPLFNIVVFLVGVTTLLDIIAYKIFDKFYKRWL